MSCYYNTYANVFKASATVIYISFGSAVGKPSFLSAVIFISFTENGHVNYKNVNIEVVLAQVQQGWNLCICVGSTCARQNCKSGKFLVSFRFIGRVFEF